MQMQDDELLRRREAEVRLTNEELRLKRELRDVLSEISRMRRENPELADLEGFKKLIGGLGVSLDSAGADGSALDIEKQRFELLKQRTALEAESAARRREEDEARIAREREILELRAEAERRSRESELEYLKERVRIEGELARLGKSVV